MHSTLVQEITPTSPEKLTIAAGQLEDARRVIEENFLAAGTLLSHTVKGIGSVISSLDNLAQHLNAELVQTTTNELKSAADHLCRLPETHTERTVHLLDLSNCSKDLVTEIDSMHTALAYMRAITVNVRIVSGMQDNCGDEFAVFADDIAECITTCSNEVTGLAADCQNLRTKLATAAQLNEQLGQRISMYFPALPEDIVQRATAISTHYSTVANTTKHVSELARDIRSNVSRTLLALQVGDMTRQRIEHVQAAVALTSENPTDSTQEDKETLTAYIHALARCLLDSTAADFSREVSEINRAMQVLAKDARQLLSLHDMAFHENRDEKGGVLHHLADKIRQVQELASTVVKSDAETEVTGRQTSDAVGRLSHRIGNIQMLKRDVHYMALNTTLRSLQIGHSGLPLSVVASALREHANKLDTAAEKCLTVLDRIMEAANHLTFENNSGSTNIETVKRLDSASTRIIEIGEATEDNIADVAQKGDEVLQNLEASSHTLELEKKIGDLMTNAANELSQEKEIECSASTKNIAGLTTTLEQLYKKYTMSQERDIHNAFCERNGLINAAPLNPEDVGCNTELF